jgi:large subunit ribosomal protein L4
MKIEVLNTEGQSTGRSIELPDAIFGIEPNEHVVYLAVKQYLANQRQGTHKAKERSEMSGSTRKLHRQKGTGGSRKGDINNPLYHGGARVFGPRPRDYSQKLNKKVKRLARKSALSSKAASGNILIIEDFSFDAPKTKAFKSILSKLAVADRRTLFVTPDYDTKVYLSSRNLQESSVVRASDLNTYEILKAQTLVFAESAVEKIKQSMA